MSRSLGFFLSTLGREEFMDALPTEKLELWCRKWCWDPEASETLEGARCCPIGESVERNGSLLPLAVVSTLKSRKELEPYEDDMGIWWECALPLSCE
jgi:hypothetical protein